MTVFVSYARDDRAAVQVIRGDLERARCQVWYDAELSGGQAWWDTVLGQIRACELFVFALSPSSLKSRACQAELNYALALRRPLLAVMVGRVSVQLAPKPIADSHIIDYTDRTAESALELGTAVMSRAAPPPLPDPLPDPPPAPMSYLNPYREQIRAEELSYLQQNQLVFALENHLDDDDDRTVARQLLTELRQRRDIVEEVGRRIDALLAAPRGGSSATTAATTAAGWHPDPTGRFDHRYWDGAAWTEHVASAEGQRTDPLPTNARAGPPGSAGEPAPTTPDPSRDEPDRGVQRPAADPFARGPDVAAPPRPTPTTGTTGTTGTGGPAAFGFGAYVALIIATVLFGIVGVIVGAINLKHPARKGQAQVLLWLGIGMIVLSIALLGG